LPLSLSPLGSHPQGGNKLIPLLQEAEAKGLAEFIGSHSVQLVNEYTTARSSQVGGLQVQ
jgi:hypothetical protein